MKDELHPVLAYRAIASLVRARTGLSIGGYRAAKAEAAIQRAMSRAGTGDVRQYFKELDGNRLLFDDLVAEMTVGETYFFREPRHFEFLRHEALPDLEQRRRAGHLLRVWSAGCASGEEPYSLAIMLDELGWAERASILGTDICRPALAKAGAAVFGSWSFRGVDDRLVQRYFHHHVGEYALTERIRRRVTFRYLNLILDPFPYAGEGGFDVVLCRNVLIYFHPDAVHRVGRRLFDSLADGGWLVTGSSDPPLRETAPYRSIVTPFGMFYQREGRGLPPVHAARTRPAETATTPPRKSSNPADGARIAPQERQTSPARSPNAQVAPDPEPTRAAPAAGDSAGMVGMTGVEDDPLAAAVRVRTIADTEDPQAALSIAEAAVLRHPLSAELCLLRALLHVELGQDAEAADAVRRAVYLDPSAGTTHLLLASILQRRGDTDGAQRCLRNAERLVGVIRAPLEPMAPPARSKERRW